MDDRQQQLGAWLNTVLQQANFSLTIASADASFRRYFRVNLVAPYLGFHTLIAMDAPPPQEDCTPFVNIAKLFLDAGLNVPQLIAQDLARGFLSFSNRYGVTAVVCPQLARTSMTITHQEHAHLIQKPSPSQHVARHLSHADKTLQLRRLAEINQQP